MTSDALQILIDIDATTPYFCSFPSDSQDFLSALVRDSASQPLRPPLPDIVRRVLSRCRFAYLSTVDVDARSSHLSLMRFTYHPEEEIIIMSTNVKTKKYDMLEMGGGGVALLVHDFSDSGSGVDGGGGDDDGGGGGRTTLSLTGEYSITLNGTCSIVRDGACDAPMENT
jgi:hypothetical protein